MDFIKKILEDYKSQSELAKVIGVTQNAISKWLHGEFNMRGEHISPLVKASNGKVTHQEICDELYRLAEAKNKQ